MKKLEFPILLVISLIALGAIFYGRFSKMWQAPNTPLAIEEPISGRPQEMFVVPAQTAQRKVIAETGESVPTPRPARLSEPLPTPLPVESIVVAIKPIPDSLQSPPVPTPVK